MFIFAYVIVGGESLQAVNGILTKLLDALWLPLEQSVLSYVSAFVLFRFQFSVLWRDVTAATRLYVMKFLYPTVECFLFGRGFCSVAFLWLCTFILLDLLSYIFVIGCCFVIIWPYYYKKCTLPVTVFNCPFARD